MQLRTILIAIVVGLFPLTAPLYAQQAAQIAASGEIIVKFRPGATAAARATAHSDAGGTLRSEIPRTNVQLVSVRAGSETVALARYRANPNVAYAEPNYIRTIPTPSVQSGAPIIPRDFHFDQQWGLNNTGQLFYCIPWIGGELCLYVGTPDADIDAPEAWAVSTGSANVTVAVIDSGVDHTHLDLAQNYAGGYDFVNNDPDPMDDHGHGTHVAGTIAAAMNNLSGPPDGEAEEGVVGIAPGTRFLSYKVCNASGNCTDFAIQQAIAQAVVAGARVINMSLGGGPYSESTNEAVQLAWNAGVVIVAAAGNAGSTALTYPAAYENVVSVAAFDEDHRRASFSNFGSWVDIAAPGNVILSTYPMFKCAGTTTTPGDIGCYSWNSGTSMASPHVAGAVALILSRLDVTSASQAVDILFQSADPQGVDAVRLDSWTLHGGLNLFNAMSHGVSNVPPTANAGPDQTVTDADGDGWHLVSLDGTGSSDPDGSIVMYEWREGTLVASGATADVLLSVGTHTLTLHITDDDGATATDTVTITINPGNVAPTAAAANATTTVGTPVNITLAATDSATCELTFSIAQSPSSGSLGQIQDQPCAAGPPNLDTATITYTPGSVAGTYTFTYVASDGSLTSNAATVTIVVNAPDPPPPATLTVTGINPNVVKFNAGTLNFVITGTGFAPGAAVSFVNGSGQAPRLVSVTYNSSTQLTALVEIRPTAPRKTRVWDVRVTNPDGSSATGAGLLTLIP